jgi:phosphoribosylformylglycinamidine cyclo-ligase
MTDYKSAGVDRAAGEEWLLEMGAELEAQKSSEVLSRVGGYGAEFRKPADIEDPIWVASTDGVGTKLILAEEVAHQRQTDDPFFGIGIDLVSMSANDVLACRARPLVFLDYLATGKIHKERQKTFLRGVIEGCRQAQCSLVGGETAEMPGFYPAGRMDVAGFCVGVRDGRQRVDPMQVGDELWALSSSGFHSNGYSLIRKLVSENHLSGEDREDGVRLHDFLLRPTRIYSAEILPLLREPEFKAVAHITGGGVVENLPRVFSEDLQALLDQKAFRTPRWMLRLVELAKMNQQEAYSTWNMGVGMVAVVTPSLGLRLEAQGWMRVGHLQKRKAVDPQVVWA